MAQMVYLDHAATTPVDDRVVEAMLPYFSQSYGNPGSVHRYGQTTDAAVARARHKIAKVLNCQPDELIFTGSGSESDNLALVGSALAGRERDHREHVLVSAIEHDAILATANVLARRYGFEVEQLPVDQFGQVSPETLSSRLRPQQTAVVSIMYANNEVGTVLDLPALARICREAGVPFHSDAVQAGSQLALDVQALGVDMLSLGAHKFYGPKGVGALFIRRGLEIEPVLHGGGQERGLRPGTHNVPLIVGMAEALAITESERESHNQRFAALRNRLISGVLDRIEGSSLTGHPDLRLPNHASFIIDGVDGNALLAALDLAGFACSSGSACKTGDPEPSSVLLAMGYSPDQALSSLRLTVGRSTTSDQVEAFLEELPQIVRRIRSPQLTTP